MSKFRDEDINNILDTGGDFIKGEANALSFDCFATMPERYKRRDIRLHMHARGGVEEFCAIFQYSEAREKALLTRVISSVEDNNWANARFCGNNLNKSMFVSIINLMEPIERIPPSIRDSSTTYKMVAVPSVVWLQPLDSCLMFAEKVAYHIASVTSSRILKMWNEFSPSPPCSFSGMPELKYRELGIPCGCIGFQQGKLINQPIKSRTKVMRNFSDIDPPLKRRWRAISAHAIDIMSKLCIELRLDGMIVGTLPEGILGKSETLNFTYCTPYLEARAIQRMHMLYYPYEEENEKDTKDSQRV